MTSGTHVVYGNDGDDGGGGPSAAELEQQWRARERPQNEVPAPVAISRVLARTDDVAVLLAGVQVHSTGFAISVAVRLRRTPARHRDLFHQISGHQASGEALLVGVEFADGRRACTPGSHRVRRPRPGVQGEGQSVVLTSGGSGGGGRTYDQDWWVSPLPPRGRLLFVVRWDAQGVPETLTEVDATVIADAGQACEQLWPWEPDPPEPEEVEPPSWPTDGWFAQ